VTCWKWLVEAVRPDGSFVWTFSLWLEEFRASVFKLFPFLSTPPEFDFKSRILVFTVVSRDVFLYIPTGVSRQATIRSLQILCHLSSSCFAGILLDLYPRGAWFLSQAWRQISWQFFHDFSSPLNKFRDIVASRPRSHPSVHFSFYHTSVTTPMTLNSLWNVP